VPSSEIVTAERQFPITSRLDVQNAIEELLKDRQETLLVGVSSPHHGGEAPGFGQLLDGKQYGAEAGPVEYDEIDVGAATPARALKTGLWLSQEKRLPFAVLLTSGGRFGLRSGVHIAFATPAGERGSAFSHEFFREIELWVSKARTYRGRTISLEGQIHPMGGGSAVRVHRLAKVSRENVVLPPKTLTTLDRNVAGFMAARAQLKALQFQSRKGLLFYGPPGTGKTYTIH